MKPNVIYILQAVGFFLQVINVDLVTEIHSRIASILIAGAIGAFQYYLQHAGIQVQPPSKAQ
jgi:hypothetical protein